MFDPLNANQKERDAWFLKMYAKKIEEGQERTIDIPSVIANVLRGIAERIER